MTQISPTTVISDQAMIVVGRLHEAIKAGAITDINDITTQMRAAITSFVESAGHPIAKYDPVSIGEPPDSKKANRFISDIQHDINIMGKQTDFLRAAIVNMYNVTSIELGLARNENNKIRNKLTTLELYSSNSDPNIITFTESFASDNYIDENMTPVGSRASTPAGAYLTLGRSRESKSLLKGSKMEVLSESNGFLGNPLEVTEEWIAVPGEDLPATRGRWAEENTTNDGATEDGEKRRIITFVGSNNVIDDIRFLTDEDRYTRFEYSAYLISKEYSDRVAKGYNLAFLNPETGEKMSWHGGPGTDHGDPKWGSTGNVLVLGLQIELKTAEIVNHISYDPYGMDDNANGPVEISTLQTSLDGVEWDDVVSPYRWIATNQNVQSMRSNDSMSIGETVWTFKGRNAKYIRMIIKQQAPMDIRLGHIYYESIENVGERVEGPLPPVDNPMKFNEHDGYVTKNTIQRSEVFPAKRWAIGAKGISVDQVEYDEESVMVSEPVRIPGVVDRVSLDADVIIPDGFDHSSDWVKYYISGDNGLNWHQIARATDYFKSLPEVVSFNDPTPVAFRESGVEYITTDKVVESIRVKIALSRPGKETWATPMVRAYSLRVKKK